jgi:hypothetical protein
MPRSKRYTRNLGRKKSEPLPSTLEWVRFEHTSEPYGVFSYLKDARATLSARLVAEVRTLGDWFAKHLDAPPDHIEIDDERFWFRAEAIEYVGRARRLADLVTRAGFPMVERRTRVIPGRVTWQDRQQLAILSVGE